MANIAPISPSQITLSRYLTENPADLASRHSCKSKIYCVAAVICAIAAIAILGSITAVYLGLLAETALSGSAVLSSLAGFIASMVGVSTFISWSKEEEAETHNNKLFATKLQEIEHWTESDVQKFFSKQGIDMSLYTDSQKTLLAAQKPAAPLTALLPLIARYLVLNEAAEKMRQVAQKQIDAIPYLKAHPGMVDVHQKKYEKACLLSKELKLQAAFYLQCLKDPNLSVPKDRQIVDKIFEREQPEFSRLSKLYNLIWYRATTPKVTWNHILQQRVPEVRRLLFA